MNLPQNCLDTIYEYWSCVKEINSWHSSYRYYKDVETIVCKASLNYIDYCNIMNEVKQFDLYNINKCILRDDIKHELYNAHIIRGFSRLLQM